MISLFFRFARVPRLPQHQPMVRLAASSFWPKEICGSVELLFHKQSLQKLSNGIRRACLWIRSKRQIAANCSLPHRVVITPFAMHQAWLSGAGNAGRENWHIGRAECSCFSQQAWRMSRFYIFNDWYKKKTMHISLLISVYSLKKGYNMKYSQEARQKKHSKCRCSWH